MAIEKLDVTRFKKMVIQGGDHLYSQTDHINLLNVFPVPDGDTGLNMSLTMNVGIQELEKKPFDRIGEASKALSRGLLMGARGNSGIILSQLFRGFSQSVSEANTLDVQDFAKALQRGVDTAYKAVIKPVEGTMLTVAREAAACARQVSRDHTDFIHVMDEIVKSSRKSLEQTTDLLPMLNEAGVVDSGGQGLVAIYEGFLAGLKGEYGSNHRKTSTSIAEKVHSVHHQHARAHTKTEDIKYGYCTEFMVKRVSEKWLDENEFRDGLKDQGDSLIIVSDMDLMKVHIHTEFPGKILSYGQRYGELVHIKIENMRHQHRSLVKEPGRNGTATHHDRKKQPYGFVVVASGEGTIDLFKRLGATIVLPGGRSMNPSTEDFVTAAAAANAEHIFILPNHSHILMAAYQAAGLIGGQVRVIPTKTIPQGIAALVAFHSEADYEANSHHMTKACLRVKSGQVAIAVRDTKKDPLTFQKGDFIATADGELVAADKNQLGAAKQLLKMMIDDDKDDIVTILYGENASEAEAQQLKAFMEECYPDIEVDVHHGGQPIYSYIVSVE